MITIALGIRLALMQSLGHRWRQAALLIAGFTATFLMLFGTGVLLANQRQQERIVDRVPILGTEDDDGAVLLVPRASVVDGKQYVTIWTTRTAFTNTEPPPGLPRFPTPGEAFISPALAAYAERDPAVAARYPKWSVIESQGLVSSDELLAYVGLPLDRLPGRAYPVVAFGRDEGTKRGLALGATDLPTQRQVVTGVLLFLLVPALLLLYLGVSAASGVRDHRFSVLHWLGAPRHAMALVAAIETSCLLAPAIVAACSLSAMLLPTLGPLPIISMDPMQGDLVLPWWIILTEGVACLGAGCAFAVAGPIVAPERSATRPRPGLGQERLHQYRYYPLVVAAVILFSRSWFSDAQEDALLVVAILLLIVGVPLIAPSLVRSVGIGVAQLPTVPALLAGRRLSFNPLRNSRPHIAAATLVTLTLAVLGYQKLTDSELQRSVPMTVAFATVDSGVIYQPDAPALSERLRPALVAVVREQANRWMLGASCADLAKHVAGLGCDPDRPEEFDAGGEEALIRALGLPDQLRISLDPRLGHGDHENVDDSQHSYSRSQETSEPSNHHDGLIVIDGTRSASGLEELVTAVAADITPGASVEGVSRFNRYYPASWSWTLAGLALAAAVLALGTAVPIIDSLISTRGHRRHLLKIGLVEGRLRFLEGLLFGIPFGTVVVTGAGAGVLSCWLLVRQSEPAAPMPWASIMWVAASALLVAVVGSLAVAVLAGRDASTERRD